MRVESESQTVPASPKPAVEPHFKRAIGSVAATAINMTQMCGIGPFITIPSVIAAMNGPQAMFGWIVGAALVLADGLIWSELGASMPGAGGTYLYFREAFQYRTGRLMPFLFVWTAMIFIPLIMSTGVIGIVDYIGYYYPTFSPAGITDYLKAHHPGIDPAKGPVYYRLLRGIVSIPIIAIVVIALYRRIGSIKVMTIVLWIVMVATVALVILASFTHFNAHQAFAFPSYAFSLHGHTTNDGSWASGFFVGLGAAMVLAVYDYLGYNTTAYMAAEVREPGKTIPRSIVFSILGMMVIYLVMNIGILGVVPWEKAVRSSTIASDVLEACWGTAAAKVVTGMIIITAFGSLFAGLLGGSRVPYEAARDKVFIPVFGRLHPRGGFPHVALIAMGVVTAVGAFFDLSLVLAGLTAVMVLVQCIGQVAAVFVLRSRQPQLRRPYRMWFYPLPAIVALIGWGYVYYSTPHLKDSDNNEIGMIVIWFSLAWVALGVVAFLIWAGFEKTWPFGPKEVREEFVEARSEVE